jgi:hypothetical protein
MPDRACQRCSFQKYCERRSRSMGHPAALGEDCGYLGRSAVKLHGGGCLGHSTARRRVRSRSVDPSGSTLRRRWGVLVRWSAWSAATKLGVLVRWSAWSAATKLGVLVCLVWKLGVLVRVLVRGPRCDEGGCLGPHATANGY